MMTPILATLDLIATNHDGSYNSKDARSDAKGLYWTFRFFFIIHLVIVRYVMSHTLPLTYKLQQKQLDVVKVYQAVDTVIKSLQECRNNINDKNPKWYDKAVQFEAEYDTLPSIKRITGQQTLRANYKTDTPMEYYKLSLTVPLLDRVISEMKTCFSKDHRAHSLGFFLLPSVVLYSLHWKENVSNFAVDYKSDFPDSINLEDQWELYWQ